MAGRCESWHPKAVTLLPDPVCLPGNCGLDCDSQREGCQRWRQLGRVGCYQQFKDNVSGWSKTVRSKIFPLKHVGCKWAWQVLERISPWLSFYIHFILEGSNEVTVLGVAFLKASFFQQDFRLKLRQSKTTNFPSSTSVFKQLFSSSTSAFSSNSAFSQDC